MVTEKRFKVIDGPISVRVKPGGARLKVRLVTGDEISCPPESRTVTDGYVWWQHSGGWSAECAEDGSEYYMLDISDTPPTASRTFIVAYNGLSVRTVPNGPRVPGQTFKRGVKLKCELDSRTEAGNYVWWKHADGWSSERNLSGSAIYMKEDWVVPRLGADGKPLQRLQLPDDIKERGTVYMQVAQLAKIRYRPELAGHGFLKFLRRGESVEVDMSTLTEADGYFWLKHKMGWTAWQDVFGSEIFMGEPGTIPGLLAIGKEGPKIEDLPGYREMIKQMPVALTDLQWLQYFGSNMWAYVYGKKYGYDGYSQGLHGGLDLGNSLRSGVPVYAGIDGEYVKTEMRKNNNRIWLKSGDYTFIYQHLTNLRGFRKGQAITPGTVLGEIEHHSQNNGWDHLHFEVRFMTVWIVNPLALMPQDMYDALIAAFKPTKPNTNYRHTDSEYNFFYKTAAWDRWTTPMDQPVLRLAGPIIGPRAQT